MYELQIMYKLAIWGRLYYLTIPIENYRCLKGMELKNLKLKMCNIY